MKKILACFLAAAVLLSFGLLPGSPEGMADGESSPSRTDACGLRPWNLENGYQYVIMGYYPYEADGTKAPVLWQVLDVEDGKALLYTTYIIDAHQPVEVSDRKTAEAKKYRKITDYGETDLNVWLNDVMILDLLEDEPVLAAVTEEKYGRLYPLTDQEMLTVKYGFTDQRYYEQRTRWAYATPYTLNKKLYPEVKGYFRPVTKDPQTGTSSYWVAAVKPQAHPEEGGRYLQLCAGVDVRIGHLSYGFLSRTTVGLRLAVRLDTSRIQVISGNGSIWDPCRLGYVEDKTAESPEIVTPPLRPDPTPVPTTPAPVKGRPALETPGPDVTPVPVPAWAGKDE